MSLQLNAIVVKRKEVRSSIFKSSSYIAGIRKSLKKDDWGVLFKIMIKTYGSY